MKNNNTIKLKAESVFHIPIQKYVKDFVFIINSEEYQTSSLVADLLSPLVSSCHLVDPTLNEFVINTKHSGDFNKILNLVNFSNTEIKEDEISFIIEILEKLSTKEIEVNFDYDNDYEEENNINNIFLRLEKHQRHPILYHKKLEKDVNFLSSHLNELKENFLNLIENTEFNVEEEIIEKIINNEKVVLESEDELIDIINALYLKDVKYARFYEFVDFKNVSEEGMSRFIEIFNIEHLTQPTWTSICFRLEQGISNKKESSEFIKREYRRKPKEFIEISNKPNEFNGILNYLQKNANIYDEIDINASSRCGGNLFNLIQYDDNSSYYMTDGDPNSWICFEFKNHQIIPSSYVIRSYDGDNYYHLKTWIFEGSNDNKEWVILDEQQNNETLNGSSRVNSFPILNKSQQSFKYLRLRQTGPNWLDYHFLLLNSIEFYGKII